MAAMNGSFGGSEKFGKRRELGWLVERSVGYFDMSLPMDEDWPWKEMDDDVLALLWRD